MMPRVAHVSRYVLPPVTSYSSFSSESLYQLHVYYPSTYMLLYMKYIVDIYIHAATVNRGSSGCIKFILLIQDTSPSYCIHTANN